MAGNVTLIQPRVIAKKIRRFLGRLSGQKRSAFNDNNNPRNKGLLIAICVLGSSLLWFLTSLQDTHTALLDLPVLVNDLPASESFVTLPPANVVLRVKGQGSQLVQMYFKPPSITIDASQKTVDFRQVVPSELPSNVQVESISPSIFVFQKDDHVTRKVPIKLVGNITTPATHGLLSPPRLEPDSVSISGAASLVDNLVYWPTVPLQIENLKDSISVSVSLLDSLGGLLRLSEQNTNVMVVAREFTEGSRTLDVRIQGAPSNQKVVSLNPGVIEVKYRVMLAQFRRAKQAPDFFATVSYDDIRADTSGQIRPVLHFPQGILLRDIQVIPPSLGYYNYGAQE